MKTGYILSIILAFVAVNVVAAQSATPFLFQLSSITSGIGGILMAIAIIGIVLGAILLALGYHKHNRSFPGQKGRKIGGILMMAFGVIFLFIGIVALIGFFALPWIVNSLVSNSNLSGYSAINSCIASSGISCTQPILSYSNSTGYIVLSLTQYSNVNWTTASFEFVNQTQQGIETSSGFNNAIPHMILSNGLPAGKAANLVLPFATYVQKGQPMLGYLWVTYMIPGGTQPVTEQVATIAVS